MSRKYTKLPQELADKLNGVAKRLVRLETVFMFLCSCLCLIASYFLLYCVDRFGDTSALVRSVIILLGIVGAGVYIGRWLTKLVYYRSDSTAIPRLVQGHFRFLGDGLQGIIELSEGNHEQTGMSPELCRAAIAQVVTQVEPLDFVESVPVLAKRLKRGSLLTVALLVALALFDSSAFENSFVRWINPFSSTPRYTFVKLQQLPEEVVVAHGEPFRLKALVDDDSRLKPSTVNFVLEGFGRVTSTFIDGVALVEFDGVVKERRLWVKSGDFREDILLKPVHRPVLMSMSAEVTLPEYLGGEKVENRIETSELAVVKGTSVKLSGKVSNPLAVLQVTGSKCDVEAIKDRDFSLSPFVADEKRELTFEWQDTYGFGCKKDYKLHVKALDDQSPMVSVLEPTGAVVAILQGETLIMKAKASDDYGLKRVWFQWQVYNGEGKPLFGAMQFRESLAEGRHGVKELDGEFIFSSDLFGIPADSYVEICAATNDFFPGRQAQKSQMHKIVILSKEKHAKMLEQLFDKIRYKVEEALLNEQELLNANAEMLAMDAEKLGQKETTGKLKRSGAMEEANSQMLNSVLQEAASLMKEALRNDQVPSDMVKNWNEMFNNLDNVGKQMMPQVMQSLQSAQEQSASRKEDLAKAVKMQKEIIEKLGEMTENMQASKSDFMIRNFASRLREAAKKEMAIRAQSGRMMMQGVGGQNWSELDSDVKFSIIDLGHVQKAINTEIASIYEEIFAFYAKLNDERYLMVCDAMDKAKYIDGLKKIASDLGGNRLGIVVQDTKTWNDYFISWAEMLEKSCSDCGGQGGGECTLGEEEQEIVMKFIEFLIQESDIRDKTVALEKDKQNNDEYEKIARDLSKQNKVMAEEAFKLVEKTDKQKFKEFIKLVAGEMSTAAELLDRPETGRDTVNSESAVIELLASIFKGGGKKSQNQDGQEMPLPMVNSMLQNIVASVGSGGQGNPNAGEGEGLNGEIDMRPAGDSGFGTDLQDKSKRSLLPSELPVEYREMLQNYYKELEKMYEN